MQMRQFECVLGTKPSIGGTYGRSRPIFNSIQFNSMSLFRIITSINGNYYYTTIPIFPDKTD